MDVFKEMKRAITPEVMRELPEEIRQHTVDIMHDACVANGWCSAQYDPDMRDEQKALYEKSEKLYSEILLVVPPKKRDLMQRLIDNFSSVIALMDFYDSRMAFRQGLRDGFRMAKFFDSDCAVPGK